MWPKRQFVKLRYVDIDTQKLTFNGTTDTQPSHLYHINSAFDPNGASASSFLNGFNQYAAMYRYYKVYGCKITCTFFVDDPTYSEPLNVGILMRDWQLGTYTPNEWASMIRGNPNSFTKLLIPAYKTTKVSMFRKMSQLLGDRLRYNSGAQYAATTNQNPSSMMYGYVFASTAKSNDVSPYPPAVTVWTKTDLTYYIKFYEYKYQTALGDDGPLPTNWPDEAER